MRKHVRTFLRRNRDLIHMFFVQIRNSDTCYYQNTDLKNGLVKLILLFYGMTVMNKKLRVLLHGEREKQGSKEGMQNVMKYNNNG